MPAMPQQPEGPAPKLAPSRRASPSGPSGGSPGSLLAVREDRAAAGIVGDAGRQGLGLVGVMDGDAQDRVRAEETAGIVGRHVVLADMHAGGAGGQRHVDPVVDDERDAERRQGRRRSCARSRRALECRHACRATGSAWRHRERRLPRGRGAGDRGSARGRAPRRGEDRAAGFTRSSPAGPGCRRRACRRRRERPGRSCPGRLRSRPRARPRPP